MKKLFLALTLSLTATVASANCFNFVNGQGPDKVGQVRLAARASSICVKSSSGYGGYSSTQVQLADSEGILAILGVASQLTGRCGGYCKVFDLNGGNIDGQNVNLSGVSIEINVNADPRLGVQKGTVNISGQTFLVIGSR